MERTNKRNKQYEITANVITRVFAEDVDEANDIFEELKVFQLDQTDDVEFREIKPWED